jgi:hypothetical protein
MSSEGVVVAVPPSCGCDRHADHLDCLLDLIDALAFANCYKKWPLVGFCPVCYHLSEDADFYSIDLVDAQVHMATKGDLVYQHLKYDDPHEGCCSSVGSCAAYFPALVQNRVKDTLVEFSNEVPNYT